MLKPHHLNPGQIYLVAGPRRFTGQIMHQLIIDLSLLGPLRVLTGGNRFDLYSIAYALAAQAGDGFYHMLENHIRISRAEICPQMVELLIETKTEPVPTLVVDLLTPFYDDGFPDAEVDNLLFESILELRRMSAQAAVVVSAHPDAQRGRLLHALERAADHVYKPPNDKPLVSTNEQRALMGA